MAARAIIIHSIDHARGALAAATRLRIPIMLYSAEGAAAYAGAGWFRGIVAAAQADYPAVECEAVLDCGGHAGLAMAALREGCRAIVIRTEPALRRKIAAIAAAQAARLDPGAEGALDLRYCPNPEEAVTAWLSQHPLPSKRSD